MAGGGDGDVISRVITLLDSNVMCSPKKPHKACKKTGKHDPLKGKNKSTENILKKDLLEIK